MMEKLIAQKGWKRTCTNYSRLVLEASFHVKVITGNKHEMCEDYEAHLNHVKGIQDDGSLALESAGYPHHIDPDVLQAHIDRNDLYHIICIKNPVSWFFIHNDIDSFLSNVLHKHYVPTPTEDVIKEYGRRYKGWWNILKACPERTVIIRHEDLVADLGSVMAMVHLRLGLEFRDPGMINACRGTVGPQRGGEMTISPVEFDRHLYLDYLNADLEKGKLAHVSDYQGNKIDLCAAKKIMLEKMDWETVRLYGYDVDQLRELLKR